MIWNDMNLLLDIFYIYERSIHYIFLHHQVNKLINL